MKRFLEILLNFKPGELVGSDDWGLQLLWRPPNTWAVLGILAALAALIWLTVRSYLREGELPRRVKISIAAVRIAVILLVLVILFQPAMKLQHVQNNYSTVAVLIDDSLSMSLADPYADAPEQRAILASAMDIDAAKLTKMPRAEVVRELIGRKGGVMARLAADHPLVLMKFSTDRPDSQAYVQVLDVIPMNPDKLADDGKEDAQFSRETAWIALGVAALAALVLVGLLVKLIIAMVKRRNLPPGVSTAGPSLAALILAPLAVLLLIGGAVYARNAFRIAKEIDERPVEPVIRVDAQKRLTEVARKINGTGYATDLVTALRDAAREVIGQRLAGMVIISDGQNTKQTGEANLQVARAALDARGAEPVQESREDGARRFAQSINMPVVTICVGDENPPRNIRMASLAIDSQVRKGATAPAIVTLLARNYAPGQEIEVELYVQKVGEQSEPAVIKTEPVILSPDPDDKSAGEDGKEIRKTVTIPVDFDEVGQFLFTARAKAGADEVITDDDEAFARVTVRDKKIGVLLISGDGGWEYQYLRNFLLRRPGRYDVSIWQQNAAVDFSQDSTPGMELTQLPRELDQLINKYDLVMLYDPAYTEGGFDETFINLLDEFVQTYRGGLCYIASNKHTGDNLCVLQGETNPFEKLANMLPVVLNPLTTNYAEQIGRDPDESWQVRPTSVGYEHPVMQLYPDGRTNSGIWAALPGIFWTHPVARLKLGAMALAVSSDARQPVPLVVTQLYGNGPVLYLGFDATWRWRYVEDSAFYNKFWANVTDFLGLLKKSRVTIATASSRYATDEKLRVSGEVYDNEWKPLVGEKYVVRMIDVKTKAARILELKADPKTPGAYTSTFDLDQVGQFELTASEDVDPKGITSKYITVTLPRKELARPQADPLSLAAIGTAERYNLRAGDFERLDKLIPKGKLPIIRDTTRELWNVWLAMVLLCLLLLTEWTARKKYNMA